jgi:TPR repeat protein
METALVSPGSQPTGTIAQAQREASVAAKSGDAGARADAEMKLARLYHRERDYPQAVRHYRRAAAAAEGAHKPRLRVDALILLGGSLAEMSQTAEARRQLELAQQLARQADYTAGEQNAVLQLEQLRTSRREGNE